MSMRFLKLDQRKSTLNGKLYDFHKHFGSSPLVVANIWYDMTKTTIQEARIPLKEQNEKGFRMFLAAIYFLWAYPKNSTLVATALGISDRAARGEPLWRWLYRLSAMKELKIRWDERLDDPETEVFILTIDGTDCKIWERKHPRYNQDKKQCSQKMNHGAAKYELGICIRTAKCVWINGPHRGGESDINVLYKGGLIDKVKKGKKIVADRGYKCANKPEVQAKISLPNEQYDPKPLNNFKSRARLRHETFNGRLKCFNVLVATFRQGFNKHKFVFEATAVIVQYQMDNGSPIFEV